MNRPVSIVTLSKYPDLFLTLAHSVEKYAPGHRKIVVVDGTWEPDAGWERVQGLSPFQIARQCNLGITAAGSDDVLYVNDDVEFTQPGSVEKLREIVYSDSSIGLLAPQVIGGSGNPQQSRSFKTDKLIFTEQGVPFTCVYLKREILDLFGGLDERFTEYGPEDIDFCLRLKTAGYKIAITPDVVVTHLTTATWQRNNGARLGESLEKMWTLFEQKWGHRNTH